MVRRLWQTDKLSLAILIAVSIMCIYAIVEAGTFPVEAGRLPRVIAAVTLVFCVLMLGKMFLSPAAENDDAAGDNNVCGDNEEDSNISLKDLFINKGSALLLGVVVFTLLMEYIGFIITSVLFMVAMGLYLGQKKKVFNLVYAIVCSLLLYWIFADLFSIPLPEIIF
ncbi:MAG: hypothetical protein CVU89_08455 [Firmicutes bacterium HGW-Firmicutes-14]|nr:MAG: hypothetical protein CVU89_08455 [Firmicutes bacterium HGW-Firmicutes-14]